MANKLYDKGREAFLTGEINWVDDSIKAMLVSGEYAPRVDGDEFLRDIPSSARLAISAELRDKTAGMGVADAGDAVFASPISSPAKYIVLYQDTGNDNKSRLIALLDSGLGLPVPPTGGAITLQWDNSASRIFKL